MATCTAIVSLIEDLEQVLGSYRRVFRSIFHPFTKEEIKILYDSIRTMDSSLRDSSQENYDSELIDQVSEKRILDVARKAGNYVDFWAVQCLPGPSLIRMVRERVPINTEDFSLSEITEEIVSINEEMKKIRCDRKVLDFEFESSTDKISTCLTSLRRTPNTEGKIVGLEKDLLLMLDNLTGHTLELKVFSIIGMGGIGKTTFARKLYDHPLIVHHFYVRVWVTVSQQYQVRETLLGVFRCVTVISDEVYGRSDEELREQVYRILKGRRYLIILDDIWDTKAWDDLRRTFPDDQNGSRVILTSWLRDVAVYASQDTPHCLQCLSLHESWELLSSNIFGDESCPVELVEVGKQIAYRCRGLPLALVVIGGLLSKVKVKVDVWEEVEQSVGSLVMEEAEHCLNILALSYSHLPDHLKACFLYMGIFPEDYEIPVKKLIWLWLAEGFIRPNTLKSFEEVAEDYLEDLITRSLIQVRKAGSDGKIKICSIHDMMRELCLKESHKQNFLHVINTSGQLQPMRLHDEPFGVRQVAQNLRRLSFHSRTHEYIHNTSFPYIRSFICFEKLSFSVPESPFCKHFKLLKVLDIMNIRLRAIPWDIEYLILLKFVALTVQDSSNIMDLFRFHSLQTLIVDCEWDGHVPEMFWNMLELRHLYLKRCQTPSRSHSRSIEYQPPSTSALQPVDAELPLRVLNNLRSMSTVRPISCTKKIFLSMPHLKKLGIYETEEDYQFRGWFKNLVHLKELEKIKYVFSNPFVSCNIKPDRLPSWDSFPSKLVKLTLSGTSFPWDEMVKLSILPKLEVPKLRNYAFSGAVWESEEGGFRRLRYLLIGSTNLEVWEAEGSHFPKLQHLVLRHCRSLKEIPYGIGEAPLLENIELHCCTDSAVMSARHLQEEQLSFGNDGLTICITDL